MAMMKRILDEFLEAFDTLDLIVEEDNKEERVKLAERMKNEVLDASLEVSSMTLQNKME